MTTTDDQDHVLVPRSDLAALVAELADVRARLSALEHQRDRGETPSDNPSETQVGAPAEHPAPPSSIGRRAAMAGLLGATVGGVAALASGSPAAAATGDHIVAGGTTTALDTTFLDAKGSNDIGLYVKNNGGQGVGIRAETSSAAAIYGYSNTTASAVGGFENGLDGLALNAYSDGPQLRLQSDSPNTPLSAPKFSEEGELRASSTGELWYCAAYGTPGTWRKLAGKTTAGALHVLAVPARIYDSRPGTAPAVGTKSPLAPNTARTLDLKVNSSGVPAGATAALLTVLLVNAANADGNFTVWAAGAARPQANTMVWGGSARRFTATAVTALDTQARCQVLASQTTDVVIDVVGYYR